jgi:hypothetical protein
MNPGDTHDMRMIEASVVFRGICRNSDTPQKEKKKP